MADTKHVTLSNLDTFLSKLKAKYADNTTTSFAVKVAKTAVGDKDGNDITTTYKTVSEFNTFKSGYDTFKGKVENFDYDKIHSITLKGSKATSGTTLNPDSAKNVEIDLSGYALLSDLTSVLQYKGTLATYAKLLEIKPSNTSDLKIGDVYLLQTGLTYDASADGEPAHTDTNVEYVCKSFDTTKDTVEWEKLGATYDFSAYAEKTWVTTQINNAKTSLSGDTTKLAERVTTAEGEIDTLQSDVTTLKGNITTLNGEVGTSGSVKDTATSIAETKANAVKTELTTKITTLESDLKTEITNKIGALDYNSSLVTGDFVVNVTQTDGLVSVTKGGISIATDADIENLFTSTTSTT